MGERRNVSARLAKLLDPSVVVLFDGAMGTMLYSRGVFINQCYDELCVRQPDLVRGIHEDYVRAGAEVIETNSFGANRVKLQHFGLEAQTAEINRAAASIARAAAGDDALVAGAVGPLGLRMEPYGPTAASEARAIFAEQMQALKEGGADLFVLETFGDLDELRQAVLAAREVDSATPVVAQMVIGVDRMTPFGASPEDLARSLDEAGADIIGLNCSVGPQTILEAVECMTPVTRRKLSAQPNAGMPRDVGGRSMYMASPEYMASYARHLVGAGARVVGGCCGTTPQHVRAMSEGLRSLRGFHVTVAVPSLPSGADRPDAALDSSGAGRAAGAGAGSSGSSTSVGVTPVQLAERSRFGAKLARGEFVTTVEIVPPRGIDASKLVRDAASLREAGVDAINVPDGPRAQSRMGAIATSLLIEQGAGIESVTHYCCRDRNLLGMLSDLLGASALGLRNLLLITGDPPKMGPYPNATAVFDIDAIGLTNLVARLNRGLDPGGHDIGAPTRFVVGVGVNPAALDLQHEIRRFEYKVEAGAEYAITQPVFDPQQLEAFLEKVAHVRIPVIAGVWPLVSVRNAEFLANEVPGVSVPDRVIARMRSANARSREHAVTEGIAIAREMLDRVRGIVQGVQVSAPFGKTELAVQVFAPDLAG